MKTAIINIKTKPITKNRAQKIADDLGLSLSAVINGFLNHLIKTKRIEFDAIVREEPSEYLIKSLQEAENEITSPAFDNVDDAIAWLKNPNRKYEN